MRRDAPPPGRFDDRDRFDSRGPPRGLPVPPGYGGSSWDHSGWESSHADRRNAPNGGYAQDGFPTGNGPTMGGGDGAYGRAMAAGRSPNWEDGPQKRTRSGSPTWVGDFDRRGLPNDSRDYRGFEDDYRRPGPPPPYPPGPQAYGGRFNGPEPPDSLPFVVNFRHFADWLRQAQPHQVTSPQAVEAAYEQYKLRYKSRATAAFFDEMKHKPWFREKYSPEKEMQELREGQKDPNRAQKVDEFVEEVRSGKLDSLSFDFDPPARVLATTSTATTSEPEPKDGEEDSSRREEEGSHRGQSPAVAPSSNRPTTDYVELAANATQLFIKTVTPELSFTRLEEHCAKAVGFTRLILSDPNPLKKFHRFGWIEFESAEQIPDAQALLAESSVDNFVLHLQPNTNVTKFKMLQCPPSANAPARLRVDLDQIRVVAAAFEKAGGVDSRASELIELTYHDGLGKLDLDKSGAALEPAQVELIKLALDLYLHYLRTVFSSCYYCVARYDSREQLHRRCPAHYRKSLITRTANGDDGWARELDEKVLLWTAPDSVNAATHGGLDYEAEMDKLCKAHILEEQAGKFRCNECSKLFGGRNFVQKHILSRHSKVIDIEQHDRLVFLNNYALDPNKTCFAPGDGPALLGGRPSNAGPSVSLNSGSSSPILLGPPMKIEQAMQSLGGGVGGERSNKRMRRGPYDEREERTGPPPPPPAGARLDPRAQRAVTAYDDLDDGSP